MNVFLLGILFAIIGALCGILVTKTYSGANFVPSSGCSVVGSSVVPESGLYSTDFTSSDFSIFWTTVSSSNGSVGIESDGSLIARLTAGTNTAKGSWFSGPYPWAKTIQITGDFDVSLRTIFHAVTAMYSGPVLSFCVNSDNYIFVAGCNVSQSNMYYALCKYISGEFSANIGGYYQNGVSFSHFLRLKRVGNMFTFYVKMNQSDSWTLMFEHTQVMPSAGFIALSETLNSATDSQMFTEYHDFSFSVGGIPVSTTSIFTIEDADAQTINAGYPRAFDKATFGVTTTNSPTLSFRTSDQDADGSPSWSASKTLAQLQAEANSGKQFMAIEVTASNNGASYQFDSLQVDTYNLDVTAPGIPSIDWVMSLNGGVGFAVEISEPTDVDYSHCEVEVKSNSGSWQKIDDSFGLNGSTYMKFTSNGPSPQPSGQINQSSFARWGYVAGDVVQVRCRSVDGSGNKSAWVTSSELTLEITYPEPIISAVSPEYCDPLLGSDMVIVGQNFRSGAIVTLSGELCTDLLISSNEIHCKTPQLTQGFGTLRVTNVDGKSDAIAYQIGEANFIPLPVDASQVKWEDDPEVVTWESGI